MKTKEGFPNSRENLTQQQNALTCGHGGNHTRAGVMDEIQKLLDSCYEFGINPLPQLRKCFPVFNWHYFEYNHVMEASRAIGNRSCMVWHIFQGGYVVATNRFVRAGLVYFRAHGEVCAVALETFSLTMVG